MSLEWKSPSSHSGNCFLIGFDWFCGGVIKRYHDNKGVFSVISICLTRLLLLQSSESCQQVPRTGLKVLIIVWEAVSLGLRAYFWAVKDDVFMTVGSRSLKFFLFFFLDSVQVVIRHHPFTVIIQPVTLPVLRNCVNKKKKKKNPEHLAINLLLRSCFFHQNWTYLPVWETKKLNILLKNEPELFTFFFFVGATNSLTLPHQVLTR